MRPVRLTLQAFGPYAHREVIDFQDALQAGLFGIYGQTGAGKSTIFSSMTFALFGEASRSEQDRASLRSDHADAGIITEVEFVFDVGSRRYVVVRQPEQMRPKQRGGGETRSPHEAFLFEATGLAPEQITPEHRGRIIRERKVSEVREAVEELLGYGPDQFRQIVLLPQGRFERFLSAKTPERLEILRDLFDVSLYKQLMGTLKEQADAAEQHVREERAVCSRQLLAEGFSDQDMLLAGISEAEAVLAQTLAAESDARARANAAQIELTQAQALAEKLIEAERAQEKLAGLTEREPEYRSLAERVEKAGRARFLLDLENQAIATTREFEAARRRLDDAAQAYNMDKTRAEEAEANLCREEARAPLIEQSRRRSDELRRYERILDAASAGAGEVEAAREAQREASLALEAVRDELTELRERRSRENNALRMAVELEKRRAGLAGIQSGLLIQLETARAWEAAEAELVSARTGLERQQEICTDAERVEEEARRDHERAQMALASARAFDLAQALKEGSPCPVCGSSEHPAPAGGDHAQAGLEKTLRETRQRLQAAEQVCREARESRSALKATLADREARKALMRPPAAASAILSGQLLDIQAQIEALGAPTDLEEAEAAIEALDGKIAHLDGEAGRLREHHEQVSRDAAVARARRDTILAEIPEELRTTERVKASIAEVTRQLDDLMMASESARTAARAARDGLLAGEAALKAARSAEADCAARLEKSGQAYALRLAGLGFSEEAYQAIKPAIETIETDRSSLEAFNRQLHEAKGEARAAAAATKDLAQPDLDGLKEAFDKLTRASDMASQARIMAGSRLASLTALHARIEESLRRLDEAEAASGPLRRLAALANGDNRLNLRLETFALAAMFEQVLEAANLRLGPMTSWRYRMERSMEVGRGSRGLGIEVFDAHTGKSRATETLSGGETFIAALSLALGLADIVEAANGKVRLDTIFIDEGFGSLDTENGSGTLDQVLQVLSGLVRQSRAVGLISHVPQVQEAIPNGFYVRKGPHGSHVETRGFV